MATAALWFSFEYQQNVRFPDIVFGCFLRVPPHVMFVVFKERQLGGSQPLAF